MGLYGEREMDMGIKTKKKNKTKPNKRKPLARLMVAICHE